MKSQVEGLSKELEEKREVLDQKMKDLGKYCEDLEGERARLETLLKQVEGEKTEVESLVIQMQEEIESKDQELGAKNEGHQQELEGLRQQVEELRDEAERQVANREERESQARQLALQLEEFREQLSRQQTQNEELESNLLKIQAEKAALKARLPGLVKKGELVTELSREIEHLKQRVAEGEVHIEESENRKREMLQEVLGKFKRIYGQTEKLYQRKEASHEGGPEVVQRMMGIVSGKKYTRKIRLARMFATLREFILSEDDFMGFFSYLDTECSENEEGVEQLLKLFVNSYENVKQRVFELSEQIINHNPDFGQEGLFPKPEDPRKLTPADFEKNRILREIVHNKNLLLSSKESAFIKGSVINYMRRKRSGLFIQKMFIKKKKGSFGISKEMFNSSFQKLDFCVFKAATGKSMIKEMLEKMGRISRQIKDKMNEDQDKPQETAHDQSTIYVEFG